MEAGPSAPDWQCGKKLSECFDHIFTSGLASDVTFVVGEDRKRVSAHKLVLISRSPVFYAMLEGPMAEKGEITIPDISEDTFRLFLRYLYTDTIDFTQKNVIPILSAARKYCVDILVSCCEKFLNSTLSEDNACLFLEESHLYYMENLKKDCLKLVSETPTAILQSSTFRELCPRCMTSITESDDLSVEETDVYEALIKWAKEECKRQNLEVTSENSRAVLGDILYNVRFPVMDYDFFQKEVCHDKILPSEDVVQVINYHHHKEKVSDSKLNHNERTRLVRKLWRVEGIINGSWVDGKASVSFSVSDSVHLHGFGSYYSVGCNTVNVVILENCKVVYQCDALSRVASDSEYIGEVVLGKDERIHIKPDNIYTITEQTGLVRTSYGGQVLASPLLFKKTKITFEAPSSDRNNSHQIPYLLLS